MGESGNREWEDPGAAQEALAAHARRYADLGFGPVADKLDAGGPVPSLRKTPVIVDTDIGGDPDDTVALIVAARTMPELALVCTADERSGERARFARVLLAACDRTDVPVVAGAQLSDSRYFCIEGLTPSDVPEQPVDLTDTVAGLCGHFNGLVRWVGMGPLSNLATVLTTHPELASRLAITQMGGAIRYRDPSRAEHNFRLDPAAAKAVLAVARRPWLVTSDVTFTSDLEVTADSSLYRDLGNAGAPAWARILRAHLDRWFAGFHPGSIMHDPLALSVALELPFVDFTLDRVALDEAGRMRSDPSGPAVFRSHTADYSAALSWVTKRLSNDPVPVGEG